MSLTTEAEPHAGNYSLLRMSIDYLARLILPAFFETALDIKRLDSVISPSPGYFRRQTLAAEGGPRLPLLSLSVSNYDRAEGWNHRAHQLQPRLGHAGANGHYYHVGRLSPVQVNLAAVFVTDDVDQQFAVVEQLFGDTGALQFTTIVKNDAGEESLTLDHSVFLDFGFTPEGEDDTDSGRYHNLDFGVILKTWAGKLGRLPAIVEVQQDDSVISRFEGEDLVVQPLASRTLKGDPNV